MKDTAADATAALDVDAIVVLTRLLRLEVTAFSCRSAGSLCQNEIDRRIKQALEQLYVNLVWMSALKKLPLRASLTTLYSVSATAGIGLTAVLVCRAAGAMLIRFTGHRRSDNVTSWLIAVRSRTLFRRNKLLWL